MRGRTGGPRPNEIAWVRALDDKLRLVLHRESLNPVEVGGISYEE